MISEVAQVAEGVRSFHAHVDGAISAKFAFPNRQRFFENFLRSCNRGVSGESG
jgi:hypothetical protein